MELDILELIHLKRIVENDFDLRNKQLDQIGRDDKDVAVRCIKGFRGRDYNILKQLCNENEFVCEICGKVMQKKYEGADPNTCRDCNPEIWGK